MKGRKDEGRSLAAKAKQALWLGKVDEAAAHLRRAREEAPRDPEALRTLANVALVLQDIDSAADFVEAAIAHQQAAPAAWYRELGETRTMQGKLDDAIRAFQSASVASPDDADTWRWLGRILVTIGDLRAAVVAWRRVLALSPDEWQARNELGAALMETRAFDEAATLFDEAAALADGAPAVSVNQARLSAQLGRRADALAVLEGCVARHPDHLPALVALGRAYREEQRFPEAETAFRRCVALAPDDAPSSCGLGRTLLESGEAKEALAVATTYQKRRRGHAGALALESLARFATGDREGADHLLDYGHFVVTRELPVPEGFADLALFNTALASTAARHPTLQRAPVSHATAEGLHSGSLRVDPTEPITALQASLRKAVAEYCRALPPLVGHPFVSRQPKSAFFDLWCVVMEQSGHQVPHIHPEAWLSGVYYPQLPISIRTGKGPEGWLEFGQADHTFPYQIEPPIVRVRPQEGLLVLFPSYFYHSTVPFDAEGTRISVAFDLVPTDR
jgi:uncharacterized protein (TIGR02466 family)